MGNQFRKPFPGPEEQPETPPLTAISEQNTRRVPAINPPPASLLPSAPMPPQGYVQGQHGRYGPRQGGQHFHAASAPAEPDGPLLANHPGNVPFGTLPYTPSSGNSSSVLPGESGRGFAGKSEQRVAARHLQRKPASAREREKSQESKGKSGKKKRRVPIWARVVIGLLSVLVVVGLVLGGTFIYYQVNYAPVLNSVTGQQFIRAHGDEDPGQGQSGDILNRKRFNILLLGSDTDDKPAWGGSSFLAQTVIVVSIDPGTHDVGMLSIPRDYYVPIPGYGMDKLDTAFSHGGSINNHMSGVSEVSLTLRQDFGIAISSYAWVGLQGFIKVINTVHGVDVNVIHPIVDDTYPDDVGTEGAAQSNYKRIYIPDGPQHLDGPTALEYVRSRHSTNDFDRSARQQQVLSALKMKLSNAGIIGELPQIAQDLQGSVSTSLKTAELLELGNFARSIDPNKIRRLTLGGSKYSTGGQIKTSYGTEDVVYPRCDTVPDAINAFLHITTATCNTTLRPGQSSPLLSSIHGTGDATASMPATAPGPGKNELTPAQVLPIFSNLFGLRDLLDLMSMVVLDSPQV